MEDKTIDNQVASTQRSLSSCHEPGWNDPPKWAFSSTTTTGTTPTKRLLNKRVAFPLNSGSPTASPSNDRPIAGSTPDLPPLVQCSRLTSAPHAPLSMPTGKIESFNCEVIPMDKERALDETMENLEAFMNEKLVSSSKIEEVRRRLDVLKIMWKEDKLVDDVCEKVFNISKALKNNNMESADKIHVSLMMTHATVCNTWISGIRHMILESRQKSYHESFPTASQDGPYLLPRSPKESESE